MRRSQSENMVEMTENKKTEEPFKTEEPIKVQEPTIKVEESSKTEVTKKISFVGTRTVLIEGFIQDLAKFLEELPAGEVPINIIPESSTKRTLGRSHYLVVIKGIENSTAKSQLIFAEGITALNKKLETELNGKEKDIFVLATPVNKRNLTNQYLVVAVRE
jgi:hypothetical protein